MFVNGSFLLDYECKYNRRDKYYINKNGELIWLETMVSQGFIFNPDNVVEVGGRERRAKAEWERALDEMYGYTHYTLQNSETSAERSQRRARSKINDYILCNDFDLFCTLTLDGCKIDRNNYDVIIKKLNNYLDNRVRRNGLKYVGVPELHKKGGLHFHFLCNSESMKLIDSGTVSCKGRKKPIKVSTADKYKIPIADRQTVYNIADWSLGFTTAIKCYGDKNAVANYVGKYISKNNSKVGGRWYYSGGNLNKPVYKYSVQSFNDYIDYDYDFTCDGGNFKVKKNGYKDFGKYCNVK